MVEAARLAVVVESDTKPFEAGLAGASTKLKTFGDHVSGIGATLGTALTLGAVAGTTAVVGGFAGAISAAAGFEQKMSGVKAVSGATAGEMKQLSGLALQLGKDTVFSASEAAAGIEELVKGGLTVPDIMNGAAKSTLALAAAGGVSLPEAATIAANALAQFNLKGQDMAHVADLIAGAANASALDVGQFKFSLQAAGAVAATVGFSFDDLAQAIAVMGKAGIVGQDAGTSLKTMFLQLQPSTKAAKAAMLELGITTKDGGNAFFDAHGKVKSMAEVAEILQKATANLTEQQKLQKLETIFGTDAIRAAAIMAKAGAAGFSEMAGAMGKVTADEVGAERMNNLKGSMQQLSGSVETAAITLGQVFLPAIRGAVDWATGLVNSLIPVIEDVGPKMITVFQGVAGAIGDLVKTGDIGLLADNLREAFGIDIGVLITAFNAALATVQKTMNDLAPTGERIASVVRTITDAVGQLVPQPLRSFVQGLIDGAVAANDGVPVLTRFTDAVNAVSGAVAEAVDFFKEHRLILSAVLGAVTALSAALVVQRTVLIASTVATEAMTVAQAALNLVMSLNPIMLVVVALGALVGALVYAYQTNEDFRKVVDAVWKFVKDVVLKTIADLIAGSEELVKELAWVGDRLGEFQRTFEVVFAAVSLVVGRALKDIQDAFAVALAVIAPIVDAIRRAVEDAFGAAARAASDAVAVIRGALDQANSILSSIRGAIDAARSLIGGAPSASSVQAAPAMPEGGDWVAPPTSTSGSMPGAGEYGALSVPFTRGAAAQVVNQNFHLNGTMVGSWADAASALKPELDRLVQAVR